MFQSHFQLLFLVIVIIENASSSRRAGILLRGPVTNATSNGRSTDPIAASATRHPSHTNIVFVILFLSHKIAAAINFTIIITTDTITTTILAHSR